MARLTGLQLRAARAMLRWKHQEVARRSRVSLETIKRIEILDGPTNITEAQEQAIIRVLFAAGISIIDDSGDGLGIFFKKPTEVKPGFIG